MDPTEQIVRLEVDDGVATITLDSQHNRNALSRQLVGELGERLDEVAATDGVRVIVLTNAGPSFCAGADLKERSTGTPDSTPIVRIFEHLMDAAQPTVASVKGAVRAGGIGLMASCDLVVVHESVTFALTEVRIGVAPAIISVPILRRVPPSRIAAAMLTGEPFGADEARAIGLITHVSDDVEAATAALCAGIIAGAPRAVAETKRMLNHVPGLDRATAFVEMRALSDELFSGPDAAEGMAAFREKRPPRWS
ncbi:MAG: enoyl-CoA hydratase-related protein [Ilumatobacteraceae bacterium]